MATTERSGNSEQFKTRQQREFNRRFAVLAKDVARLVPKKDRAKLTPVLEQAYKHLWNHMMDCLHPERDMTDVRHYVGKHYRATGLMYVDLHGEGLVDKDVARVETAPYVAGTAFNAAAVMDRDPLIAGLLLSKELHRKGCRDNPLAYVASVGVPRKDVRGKAIFWEALRTLRPRIIVFQGGHPAELLSDSGIRSALKTNRVRLLTMPHLGAGDACLHDAAQVVPFSA
jgi:hypothetical protein